MIATSDDLEPHRAIMHNPFGQDISRISIRPQLHMPPSLPLPPDAPAPKKTQSRKHILDNVCMTYSNRILFIHSRLDVILDYANRILRRSKTVAVETINQNVSSTNTLHIGTLSDKYIPYVSKYWFYPFPIAIMWLMHGFVLLQPIALPHRLSMYVRDLCGIVDERANWLASFL